MKAVWAFVENSVVLKSVFMGIWSFFSK